MNQRSTVLQPVSIIRVFFDCIEATIEGEHIATRLSDGYLIVIEDDTGERLALNPDYCETWEVPAHDLDTDLEAIRQHLIEALEANDPNGDYSDHHAFGNPSYPMSLYEVLECTVNQDLMTSKPGSFEVNERWANECKRLAPCEDFTFNMWQAEREHGDCLLSYPEWVQYQVAIDVELAGEALKPCHIR